MSGQHSTSTSSRCMTHAPIGLSSLRASVLRADAQQYVGLRRPLQRQEQRW
nr:hypothetical protein [Streptomyces sp. CB02366]